MGIKVGKIMLAANCSYHYWEVRATRNLGKGSKNLGEAWGNWGLTSSYVQIVNI